MAAAHAGEGWRIVSGRSLAFGRARRKMPGHHRSPGSYRYAVDKVTARDLAVHPQFSVPWIHDLLREFAKRIRIYERRHEGGRAVSQLDSRCGGATKSDYDWPSALLTASSAAWKPILL